MVIFRHRLKRVVPAGARSLDISYKNAFRVEFEVNFARNTAFFKQFLRNSDALRVTDLDDLAFHNYIVITRGE